MTLGVKLGPYEILAPLGAGGMGEVYRATDSRLARDVALKVLPEAFACDADRMVRFAREAKLLASLNHPNIAAIYGLEEANDVRALVMELVEGPTLAERIKQGAIPLDEALPIARQIADGLEYAHERAIIHRDLKPSNVKLTREGNAKILDFGLAKALEGESTEAELENSPTLSAAATRTGVMLGTAAYMAPEQARGKRVDRRADIWAFGCVLYEMLTGRGAFSGETTSDILACVIRAEPDWSLLPVQTPSRVNALLRRCLKKDPRERLQAIGEARIAIDEMLSGGAQEESIPVAAVAQPLWRRAIPWMLLAILALAAFVFAWAYLRLAHAPSRVIVSQIPPPPGQRLALGGMSEGTPVLSPDGRQLAFVAADSDGHEALWVRPLSAQASRPLAGTEGAWYPFWSPDSRSLGFFANGKLNRIDLAGGPPLPICDIEGEARGGAWGADDTILFSGNITSAVYRVSALGGSPVPITKVNRSMKEIGHRWPQFLPDHKHFLYFALSNDAANFGGTYSAALDGRETKLILHTDSNAIYTLPGYLLFVRQDTLMAQRFDLAALQVISQAVPLLDHVSGNESTHRGLFTVSANGVLAYESGSAMQVVGGRYRLVWLDRSGKQVGETGAPAGYLTPRISPDGRKLAVSIISPSMASGAIWVLDIASGAGTRLTFSSAVINRPSWSPDGKTIAYVSNESGNFQIYERAADGSGNATPMVVGDASDTQPSFSADGRYLAFVRLTEGSRPEVWAVPLFGDRKPFSVVQVPGGSGAAAPALSPDGKWLAYASGESGRREVYAVPFGHGSGKWLVSTNGGEQPHWRGDGKELFYLTWDGKMMSVDIAAQGSGLTISKPKLLFQPNFSTYIAPGLSVYDVTPDGKKFVMINRGTQEAPAPFTLLVNWPELLNKLGQQ
jgi:eukaryotic-like serine/threonine-protein kinase